MSGDGLAGHSDRASGSWPGPAGQRHHQQRPQKGISFDASFAAAASAARASWSRRCCTAPLLDPSGAEIGCEACCTGSRPPRGRRVFFGCCARPAEGGETVEAGRVFAGGNAAFAGSSSLLSLQSSIARAPAPRSETWCQAAALTCPLMMLCGRKRAAGHLSDRLRRMGSSSLPRSATAAGTRRTRVSGCPW